KVNTLGVVPYLNVDIEDEDSLSVRLVSTIGKKLIDIAVIRLPHISNFTDFNVFSIIKGVSVRYITNFRELNDPDMIIIPGTKNTIEDLKWLRQSGFQEKIIRHAMEGKAVFGICGGYQMLGETINDPDNVEGGGGIKGLGLLKTKTTFKKHKTRTQVSGKINDIIGFYNELSGINFSGYEIHMGETYINEGLSLNTIEKTGDLIDNKQDGCVNDNVAGSYIHGIFDYSEVANAIVKILMKNKGIEISRLEEFDIKKYKEEQYDILADSVRKALNMDEIYKVMGII
ncbi:MAG: cobyric acid synthase CobQ, partial [Tissierellia bacterium]|nr:cobyric acid synthase CobQ [Tissierellia bacterium]